VPHRGPPGAGTGFGGCDGKSSASRSPSSLTTSVPLFVSKAIRSRQSLSLSRRTSAVASVAWPHSATSTPGVNQRSRQPSPSRTTKAVSERLFSAAIACSVASGSQVSSGMTAAGLPVKTRLAKASTW
jgi:hypothetical protein